MAGTIFSHPLITNDLVLRLAPTEVDWSYNLVTSSTDTYAGQVVQLLSINFENFVVVGRFGRESRDDYHRNGDAWVRNSAPSTTASSQTYGPGLTQMTEWFKYYFSIASQGNGKDNYSEQPVTVTYQGSSDIGVDDNKTELSWLVYPTSFPSYKIANDNFAPEWRVECQVYEAPKTIIQTTMDEAISRLEYKPLYQPGDIWSDPFSVGPNPSPAQLRQAAKDALNAALGDVDHFFTLLPTYTESDILDLLQRGFSAPVNTATKPTLPKQKSLTKSGDPFDSSDMIPGLVPSPVDTSGLIGG